MSPGRRSRCFLLELQAGIERWESYVSRHEKKMRDMLDDEMKFAGLEALVLEELEKHLILNSNRLRTSADESLEIVTYVEAKFGLRIRDSKPSETASRGHSVPWLLTKSMLLHPAKENGHRVHEMVVSSVVELTFNETAMFTQTHAKTTASNRLAKAN